MTSPLSPDVLSQSSPEIASNLGGQERTTPAPLNLNFFKSLADKRATRELYIKALEDEVLRLKELYSTVCLEKEKLVATNQQLRDALAQQGVQFMTAAGPDDLSSVGNTSGTSPGTSLAPPSLTSFSPSQSSPGFVNNMPHMAADQLRAPMPSPHGKGVDGEQAGIDFVLALEKPCMTHLPALLERSANSDGDPCGHALMVSCPPTPIKSESAQTSPQTPAFTETRAQPSPGVAGLNTPDLATLMDLSKRLDLDGEITPVMAWSMIRGHPRFSDLRSDDIKRLADELGQKVRCYGFGAVLEEFELRDAFENILPCDPETMVY
ncbi:hypothetical protein CDD80_3538 [Ophiocordyceps camponoti-rufipedis]|uniref:BZIP domain-containing protein n=1 Tax=Ophiocordyceps camponoti-rufipedis TaxID=2004952 RepID=A0A2C5YW95_9HYPO|nr:hypothetical protein CDD80_3538 [Ophiocordyceps camponoti-rufipedis]